MKNDEYIFTRITEYIRSQNKQPVNPSELGKAIGVDTRRTRQYLCMMATRGIVVCRVGKGWIIADDESQYSTAIIDAMYGVIKSAISSGASPKFYPA